MIDSNVLVYAYDGLSPHHEKSREALTAWLHHETCVFSWQVAYEFLRVATHPKASARPAPPREAEGFLEALLAFPSVRFLSPGPRHLEFYRAASAEIGGAKGNDVHDARLVALMREHDDRRILSADDGFRRFKGIRVEDPRN